MTYSISSGNGNNWFEIDASGNISPTAAGVTAVANDYEGSANIHNLVVTATHGTNSTNINVTLNEQDINDNAPVFVYLNNQARQLVHIALAIMKTATMRM